MPTIREEGVNVSVQVGPEETVGDNVMGVASALSEDKASEPGDQGLSEPRDMPVAEQDATGGATQDEGQEQQDARDNDSLFWPTKIDADGFTVISMRVGGIDPTVLERYREAITQNKRELPMVIVYEDSETGERYSGDGAHRSAAYKELGKPVPVGIHVVKGAKRRALYDALRANDDHGFARSQADKRNAVKTALNDPEWGKWKPAAIARITKTSYPFVKKYKRSWPHPARRIAPAVRLSPMRCCRGY